MQDAATVRGLQSRGASQRHRHRRPGVEALPAESVGHGSAGQILHHQQAQVVVLDVVVDGDDVRVVDGRHEACLGDEATTEREVIGELGRDLLDRDGTLQLKMHPGQHDATPAAPDLPPECAMLGGVVTDHDL